MTTNKPGGLISTLLRRFLLQEAQTRARELGYFELR